VDALVGKAKTVGNRAGGRTGLVCRLDCVRELLASSTEVAFGGCEVLGGVIKLLRMEFAQSPAGAPDLLLDFVATHSD
jgi:hypothetical protein